jgi:hypothetical protein
VEGPEFPGPFRTENVMAFGFTHPNSWLREDEDFDGYNKPGSPDWFSLSDDVSFAKANNRHDAIKVESLLGYGGYLDHDKGGGPLGLSNRKLEQPIKAFQAKNGLKVDGLAPRRADHPQDEGPVRECVLGHAGAHACDDGRACRAQGGG